MTVQPSGGTTPPPKPSVYLVSGKQATVQTPEEAEWFEETRDTYLTETKFTDATDLRDLDRLLILELMIFRWTQHLAAGEDYVGDMTEDEQLRKNIKEYSDQINKIKDSMGLNKKSRDAAATEGNFQAWLEDLKVRGKAFGINREMMLTEGLVLFKEIFGTVEVWLRSDEEERVKMGYRTIEDLLRWLTDVKRLEFNAVDEYFREHDQRYWIRDV